MLLLQSCSELRRLTSGRSAKNGDRYAKSGSCQGASVLVGTRTMKPTENLVKIAGLVAYFAGNTFDGLIGSGEQLPGPLHTALHEVLMDGRTK